MRTVAIAGLGLIGGSLALALKKSGAKVVGCDADPAQVAAARRARIDAFPSGRELAAAMGESASVVICTPLSSIAPVFRELRRLTSGGEVHFFHAGGLQAPQHLGLTPAEETLIFGTHPLAGTQFAGFAAARDDLFANCTVVVESRTDEARRQSAMELWTAAGASRIIFENNDSHDSRMAAVSHLPQLASSALALTIAERGYGAADIGTGARDATRLAGSPFSLWIQTLQRSREEAITHLARLEWNVGRIREALRAEDWEELERLWTEASSLTRMDGGDDSVA
jgi:prephenate dehydrogenase